MVNWWEHLLQAFLQEHSSCTCEPGKGGCGPTLGILEGLFGKQDARLKSQDRVGRSSLADLGPYPCRAPHKVGPRESRKDLEP